MPCFDPMASAASAQKNVEKIQRLTQLFCELCEAVESAKQTRLLSPAVARWYDEHRHLDATRRAEEAQAAANRYNRERALRKLSAHDRELLGLDR